MNHKYSTPFKFNSTRAQNEASFRDDLLKKQTLDQFDQEFQDYEDDCFGNTLLRAPSSGYYTHKPLIVVREPIREIESQFEESYGSQDSKQGYEVPAEYARQKRRQEERAEEQRLLYKQQMKYLNSHNHSCNWCL